MFCRVGVLNIRNIHGKTPVLESLFKNVGDSNKSACMWILQIFIECLVAASRQYFFKIPLQMF